MPVIVALFAPLIYMEYLQYAFAIAFLVFLGIVAARAGGSNTKKAVVRIVVWGSIAMGMTALIGHFFKVSGA